MRAACFFTVAALLVTSSAPGQGLGGLAAQEKARREREKEKKAKPAKVYTDEDLERLAAGSGPRDNAPAPNYSPSSSEGAPPAEQPNRAVEDDGSPIVARFTEAQAGLEAARQASAAAAAEVERLKQDLNPMSVTFKTDPYEILKLQGELTEAQARAADAQSQVNAAATALEAAREEARRAGVTVR